MNPITERYSNHDTVGVHSSQLAITIVLTTKNVSIINTADANAIIPFVFKCIINMNQLYVLLQLVTEAIVYVTMATI